MAAAALALAVLLFAQPAGSSCVGLSAPVPGPVVAPFAPIGAYAGHWGVDLAAPEGTTVRAAAAGTVTFAGVVAGNTTVTVDHGGGLKTSASYLGRLLVGRGAWVGRGTPIGESGVHDDRPALHFSMRIDGSYVDPAMFLGCRPAVPAPGLRLVPLP